MPSLGIELYLQVLCVVFALFSPYPNGFIKAQQPLSCTAGYVLVNSICAPTAIGQTTNGCTTTCPPQTTYTCCVPVSQCPNQPVAPLPSQPCPNQPIAPCPNQPVAPLPYQPYPNQPVAPTPYPNQPIAPCPNQPVAPLPYQPCPNQTVAPTPYPNQPIAPCPNQPVAPLPHQPCPNQPVAPTPYPNQPKAPCPNQPVTPLPYQPCPNQTVAPTPYPNQPIAPCPNQPVPPITCPNQPIAPCPNQPCPLPPAVPQSPSPPTRSPPTLPPTIIPPAPLRCPEGTIPLNNYCRLVYCNKGVYRNNKCIQTVCPEGTTWTGYRCAPVQPIVHSIAFNNEIVTHFNRTEPDIIVKNVNNMVVNASVVIPLVPAPSQTPSPELPTTMCEDNEDAEDCDRRNCCTVISPRVCQRSRYRPSKWNCYSHRYQRCGDFCIAPIVYLKAPSARETPSYVVVPPNENLVYCRQDGSCPESEDYYDCSGCAMGIATSCSSYCYNYQCSSRKCNFYDQREYCNQYPGGNGCQEQDGCVDDWCDGDDYNNAY